MRKPRATTGGLPLQMVFAATTERGPPKVDVDSCLRGNDILESAGISLLRGLEGDLGACNAPLRGRCKEVQEKLLPGELGVSPNLLLIPPRVGDHRGLEEDTLGGLRTVFGSATSDVIPCVLPERGGESPGLGGRGRTQSQPLVSALY